MAKPKIFYHIYGKKSRGRPGSGVRLGQAGPGGLEVFCYTKDCSNQKPMRITNEPIEPGSPVKFQITGFPEETAVRASIERFYALKKDAPKDFVAFNAFAEQIFTGRVDDNGKIMSLSHIPRSGKSFNGDKLN
jgi:hypothetical protein